MSSANGFDLAALHDGKGESQALLLPITFDLEASARTALEELQDYLTTLGFDIRPFGGKTYQVQAAPPYFRPADTPDLITELVQARADGRSENSIEAKQEDLASVEVEAELWVIDQHAAHERVMYEQVLAALHDGKGESQALLLPITFDLEASARTALEELQDYLTTLGFDIRPFGGKTYQVQAAPPYFRPADTPDLITELVQARADGRSENSIEAKQEDLAARVACKVKSVKAGQTLTPEPMKALVKSLLACQSPFVCPHGRPTMVRMSVKHLEGQFDRR